MFLLEVEHLSCSLRPGREPLARTPVRTIFRDVSFAIEEGETFGLLGASGAGKTTLARCIVGLQDPDGGEIKFAGSPLWPQDRRRMPDPRIQMLFQASSLSLDPTMMMLTAIEEGFAASREALTDGEKRARVETLLAAVDLDASVLTRYPHELSGGQRQRVALTRALASRPSLLILDEPTAALDPVTQLSVLTLLRSIQTRLGLTLIYITHDRPTARSMCGRIGILEDGVIRSADR